MKLAIFDLDNTLIAGDSDHAWGQFLVEHAIVDGEAFKQANDQFYQDYCIGELDIYAYLRFALTPLSTFSPKELSKLHAQFIAEKITPIRLNKAQALVDEHRAAGDILLVITATNRFVTEPIVRSYGIPNLLASEAEIVDGRYTGEPSGTPCFAEGKIEKLNNWLSEQASDISALKRVFYSDSRNDLPLLSLVDEPIAVDPDPVLHAHAKKLDWRIISLR